MGTQTNQGGCVTATNSARLTLKRSTVARIVVCNATQEREKMKKITEKDLIGCHECDATNRLVSLAHRRKDKKIVGWIFLCEKCYEVVAGQELKTEVIGVAQHTTTAGQNA